MPPTPLRFTSVPSLGIELLHTANVTHQYPPHLHEVHSIGVMLSGEEHVICAGGTHVATAGDLLLINAEDVHANRSIASEYLVMKMTVEALDRLAVEIGGRAVGTSCFDVPVARDARVFTPLARFLRKCEEGASRLELESELMRVMRLVLTRHARVRAVADPRRSAPRAVEIARDYLKDHYASDVSLADLNSVAGLSAFYLLRRFREQTGVPPHEYQTQVRIAHARKLLRAGHAIADTALQTGFFDQSHLSRSFKRIVGMTPGQYVTKSKIVQEDAGRERVQLAR